MNKNKKIFLLIALILATIVTNFVVFSMQRSELGGGKIENTYLGPNGETIYVDESEFATSQNNTVLLIGVSSVVILILVALIIVSISSSKKQKKYDEQRIADIAKIAQGLEQYYAANNQYPLSQSYSTEHYSGINLTTDWEYYNFPSREEMQKYIPDWPLHDPSINPKAKSQMNNYIYFPRNQGKAFDLYAHLDAPDKNATVNYNTQDQLPEAWGSFNYKVSSQPHVASPANAANTAPIATNAEPVAIEPKATPYGAMQTAPIEPTATSEAPANPSLQSSSPIDASSNPVVMTAPNTPEVLPTSPATTSPILQSTEIPQSVEAPLVSPSPENNQNAAENQTQSENLS